MSNGWSCVLFKSFLVYHSENDIWNFSNGCLCNISYSHSQFYSNQHCIVSIPSSIKHIFRAIVWEYCSNFVLHCNMNIIVGHFPSTPQAKEVSIWFFPFSFWLWPPPLCWTVKGSRQRRQENSVCEHSFESSPIFL